jgi:hypothetical protein
VENSGRDTKQNEVTVDAESTDRGWVLESGDRDCGVVDDSCRGDIERRGLLASKLVSRAMTASETPRSSVLSIQFTLQSTSRLPP